MARVRVILLTYRRPQLLPRALQSLLRQTFTDWLCTVHNDAPDDPYPSRLVAQAGDARIGVSVPSRTRGGTGSFNFAHRAAAEPYQAILEDDNWWEPGFLAAAVAALDRHPEADLAWSNMRIWNEEPDGGWRDSGRCIWNLPANSPPRLFHWPQLLQFSDAIYSNGAALLRSRSAERLVVPEDTLLDVIEQTRERLMPYPILLLPEPLANFALTLRTARSSGVLRWGRMQALLGASFLASVPMSEAAVHELWRQRRASRPRATSTLIFAGLLQRRLRFLLGANPGDWLHFLKGCLRRPVIAWRILRSRRELSRTWDFLRTAGATRTEEARRRGFSVLDLPSLADKAEPGACGLTDAAPSG